MSGVRKRSATINGHRTSYSLEQPFFDELVRLAASRNMSVAALVVQIDAARPRGSNLSSALRLFVLEQVKRG